MENLRGAAFMVFAMFCFAVEDALIKQLSGTIPAGQVLGLICLGGLIIFIAWSLIARIPLWHKDYLDPGVIARSGCEVIGSCFFVSALALIPLTTASAVIQATPLVVAMAASLFLGQPMGWRRWIAIIVGFCGVLLIIRPGMDGFIPATLLAVGGMLGLAARDILTRKLDVDLTGVHFGIHAFAIVTPPAFLLPLVQGQMLVWPQGREWVLLGCGVGIGTLAYLFIVAATRIGNAGIISSFRYSRMLFALIIGFVFFAERPDFPTILGATIIIASGIYTLWREARIHRASLAENPAL
ncbi:DMT family transporter [Cognatiyoonia sp. IB215446]|uniref:DMT family transporter n=1 Tax=Cognatiyoonia sp. IB215446 TaxID=3097355 RepID=UPI002A14B470|nr:DMT family transporter [Cognatiyoonia sp. IB215446]MDX8348758.1 DMT family transporter [Cognatiyoonia sp. IB215446]